jgi:hypothetical protein
MAFWFGRKSAPEARPFVPAWLSAEGEQGGFARGYEAQLDEVYRRNPVGLRAVRLVAGLIGGLPIFGDEKAVKLIKDGGLLERAAANLLLHGNAYARLVSDSHDRPVELHLLRPERVSVVSGADGWPSAYLYRAAGQVVRVERRDPLERLQVAHLKALNPADDHYGLGCLEAAIGGASVHNRARQRIDLLLCPVVESTALASPPASPAAGACYLVASGGSGDWASKDGMLAGFSGGGWRFIAPVEGLRVVDRASGELIQHRGGAWETGISRALEYQVGGVTVVRQQQPPISDPAGGGVIDTQGRAAIASILSMLRTHGLIA